MHDASRRCLKWICLRCCSRTCPTRGHSMDCDAGLPFVFLRAEIISREPTADTVLSTESRNARTATPFMRQTPMGRSSRRSMCVARDVGARQAPKENVNDASRRERLFVLRLVWPVNRFDARDRRRLSELHSSAGRTRRDAAERDLLAGRADSQSAGRRRVEA